MKISLNFNFLLSIGDYPNLKYFFIFNLLYLSPISMILTHSQYQYQYQYHHQSQSQYQHHHLRRELTNNSISRKLQVGGSNITLNVVMVIVCICCASIACGLTQGLLSLNPLEMNVKMRSGSTNEKKMAGRVLPLITKHHLLLVTLMLFNASANEALPLFLDQLVPGYITIVLSVTLVLTFGEILPSALLTGPNQLQIASVLAPLTWCIIFLFYPIAYPISKALDAWLGHDDGMTMFNRKEIYTMMKIQQEEAPKRGISEQNAVANEEVLIIGGALTLRDKTVGEVMTKEVFMLSMNEKLTTKTLWKIFHSGCSRIPIYELNPNDVVGLMLVKDLLFIDPDDEIPIRNFMTLFGRPVQAVWPDQKLHEILKLFKLSSIHMAIVRDVNSEGSCDPFYEVKGIITMEDVFEELIGEEIMDETDGDYVTYRKLRKFHPEIDFAQMKHILDPKVVLSQKQLSEDELKTVVSYLNSQVPQIAQLFGKDNNNNNNDSNIIDAITKLVKSSQVMYIKSSEMNRDDQNVSSSPSDASPLKEVETSLSSSLEVITPVITESGSSKQGIRREYLYKQDKASNACTLILNGTLKIIAGKEEFEIEKGPWSIIGADILLEEDGIYISDFSAYIASPEFRCLRIMKPTILSSTSTTSGKSEAVAAASGTRTSQNHSPEPKTRIRVASIPNNVGYEHILDLSYIYSDK